MSDEGESPRWWQTVPGILAAVAAIVTALTGLIVAINQTGWFARPDPPAATKASTTTTPPGPSSPPAASTSAASPSGPPRHSVALPALRDYKLGTATFTLLRAEVSSKTTEKNALQVRVRMLNRDRYDANFKDSWFRLIVDGVPMAPESDLNELVAAQSAKDGEVLFVVPRETTSARLKIAYGDDSTEIPLSLTP
jgi:hypothetical protein